MSDMRRTEWEAVTPFPDELSIETQRALRRVDAFRDRWREFMNDASEEEINDRRDRNLRRHAIETGIIEHLYDVSWGVTEELVAEGITLDAAEREGDVSEDTLATINAQLEGLQLLVGYVKEDRQLTSGFIRDLHAAIAATQTTYDARDQFGRSVVVPLDHGAWKQSDNHVTRPDGSVLEYTPAIFVQDEMDTIVGLYDDYFRGDIHPVALAAWLHHRFIRVHPFSDGNGRVARALTLLALIQKEFTPLVVRRETREEYIEALDRANDGDLEVLIRLFARLEEYAISAELEVKKTTIATTAVEVANEYAKRLKAQLEFSDKERKNQAEALAAALHERINETLTTTAVALRESLSIADDRCDSWMKAARPGETESTYWKASIIRAAREVDFYANIHDGAWWNMMNLKFLGASMRYAVVVQKVGHGETGILAVTFFAETKGQDDGESLEKLVRLTPADGSRMLHTDELDDVWAGVDIGINKTMTAAVSRFLELVG
jgi:Fic family protein